MVSYNAEVGMFAYVRFFFKWQESGDIGLTIDISAVPAIPYAVGNSVLGQGSNSAYVLHDVRAAAQHKGGKELVHSATRCFTGVLSHASTRILLLACRGTSSPATGKPMCRTCYCCSQPWW